MARIVVVGSVAQDEVLHLLQPLREGSHLDATRRERRLGGGAANTALPLRHAGHEVVVAAPLGSDETGDWLLGELEAAGIDTSGIVRVAGTSTRSVVLLDPRGERTIVNVHRCPEEGLPARLERLEADAFYVRSREGGLADRMEEVCRRATVVAHVPPVERGARPAHVLVGSESDLPPAFVGDPWDSGGGIAGPILRWVVMTRGSGGAQAVSANERIARPAPRVTAVDTTGAGDVFAAGLVHSLLQNWPMQVALETASSWGAAAAARHGMPGRGTIQGLL